MPEVGHKGKYPDLSAVFSPIAQAGQAGKAKMEQLVQEAPAGSDMRKSRETFSKLYDFFVPQTETSAALSVVPLGSVLREAKAMGYTDETMGRLGPALKEAVRDFNSRRLEGANESEMYDALGDIIRRNITNRKTGQVITSPGPSTDHWHLYQMIEPTLAHGEMSEETLAAKQALDDWYGGFQVGNHQIDDQEAGIIFDSLYHAARGGTRGGDVRKMATDAEVERAMEKTFTPERRKK